MTEDEKLQEVVAKLIDFLLTSDGQQGEWLRDLRREEWHEQTVRKSAREQFNGARMAHVDHSVAYRLIRGAIQKADCTVPHDLNRIMAVIYKN